MIIGAHVRTVIRSHIKPPRKPLCHIPATPPRLAIPPQSYRRAPAGRMYPATPLPPGRSPNRKRARHLEQSDPSLCLRSGWFVSPFQQNYHTPDFKRLQQNNDIEPYTKFLSSHIKIILDSRESRVGGPPPVEFRRPDINCGSIFGSIFAKNFYKNYGLFRRFSYVNTLCCLP